MSSIVLIIQIILALLMLYHAVPKLIFSKEKLKSRGGKEIEYVDDIGKDEIIELDPAELLTPIDLQDLSSFYRNYNLKEHINKVEIILDLQSVEDKLLLETSSFIDKIFPKDE